MSGRTAYLVCGPELEDGRPVAQGSKHREAAQRIAEAEREAEVRPREGEKGTE